MGWPKIPRNIFMLITATTKETKNIAIEPWSDFLSVKTVNSNGFFRDSPTQLAIGSPNAMINMAVCKIAGSLCQNQQTRIKKETGKYTVP